jgi:hydrogenase maturation protein HypF
MELEFAAAADHAVAYPFELKGENPIVIDWQTAIFELLRDQERREAAGTISARFHNMLVEIIAAIARRIGKPRVALSGGCFQNRYLTERVIDRLRADGFQPFWPQRVPPNDGGISLGQILAAASSNSALVA